MGKRREWGDGRWGRSIYRRRGQLHFLGLVKDSNRNNHHLCTICKVLHIRVVSSDPLQSYAHKHCSSPSVEQDTEAQKGYVSCSGINSSEETLSLALPGLKDPGWSQMGSERSTPCITRSSIFCLLNFLWIISFP